jgi:CheY-like chemotaxis protein
MVLDLKLPRKRSLKAGFDGHLTKPITIEKLLEAVHRVANSSSPDQAQSEA